MTLDTTRADHLGCYGYERAETPALDRLARAGIRFSDAVAPTSMTLPSHTSIFTGLDPPHHGVRDNAEYILTAAYTTLAEILRDHGYETVAFVSSFVLDSRFGLDQGFQHYDDQVATSTDEAFGHSNQRDAGAVTQAVIRWLTQRKDNRPFFAWVHYFDPHEPYQPPPPFAERFHDRPYDGEIAYMDSQIGRLLDALQQTGLWGRTLIIAIGDHGESLGEHEEATHGLLIYEATQHVPLILACPGLFRGPHVVRDSVVSATDTFPTVLDLLGVRHEGRCDGKSLLSAWNDTQRVVYMETLHTYLAHGWAPLYGLRRHGEKYILAPRPEFYDLQSDPHELRSLYNGGSTSAKKSIATLEGLIAARLPEDPSAEEAAAVARLQTPETLQRLASLGYVSGDSADGTVGVLDPKDMMPTWRKIREARRLIQIGRPEQALGISLEALQESPHNRNVLHHLGEIYIQMKRIDEAETALRAYIDIKPSADVCILLAQIVMADGRYGEADELLDQAAELEPDHGGVYIARGDLSAWQGRFEEALASYAQARRVDPYRVTGMSYQREKRIRELMSKGWRPPDRSQP
jgi:arylsulfatase A-like enzyme/predicted negative regulator of RcsB-dependent stress response